MTTPVLYATAEQIAAEERAEARRRAEFDAMVKARLKLVAKAILAGIRCGGGRYWPELSPLNRAETEVVRERVAVLVRWELERGLLVKRGEAFLREWARRCNGEGGSR